MSINLANNNFYQSTSGKLFNSTPGYSVCGWSNSQIANDNNYHGFISKGASAGGAGTQPLWVGISGGIGTTNAILVFGNQVGTCFASVTNTIVQSNWYFWVATYLGSTVNLYAWRYTSGTMVPLTAGTSGSAAIDADVSTYNTYWGQSPNATSRFTGILFGTVFWNSALTKLEATSIAYGASPFTIRPESIVNHFNFDFPGDQPNAVNVPLIIAPTRGQFNPTSVAFTGGISTHVAANPPLSGLSSPAAPTHYRQAWDQRLPIASQTAARPFLNPFPSNLAATPFPGGALFRRTLSPNGTRVGARQSHGYMNG